MDQSAKGFLAAVNYAPCATLFADASWRLGAKNFD
jgi:hypothetical protein